MSADSFDRFSDSPSSPARRAFAIAPHDSEELTPLPKALFVGIGGALSLRAADSAADVTLMVGAGQILPIRARFVRASGTTAAGIVGLA